ncbi:MAG: hypothetical protein AAF456_00095 [Planctomycetota bacterium]
MKLLIPMYSLIGLLAAINLVHGRIAVGSSPPPEPSGMLTLVIGGIVAAQPIIVGSWLVYGAGSLMFRFLVVASWSAILCGALLFGYSIAFGESAFDSSARTARGSPLAVLAVAATMASAKFFRGQSVTRPLTSNGIGVSGNQVSISDIMVITAMVGLAIAVLPPAGEVPGYAALGIAWGVYALATLMVFFPAFSLALGAEESSFRRDSIPALFITAFVALTFAATFAISIVLVIIVMITGDGPVPEDVFAMIFLICIGVSLPVSMWLCALRMAGVRVDRLKSRKPLKK